MYVRTPHYIITELDERTRSGFPTDQNFFNLVLLLLFVWWGDWQHV